MNRREHRRPATDVPADQPDFVAVGTLVRPGPIGRLVRLTLGALCLATVGSLIHGAEWTSFHPIASLPGRLPIFLVPLCTFNYVVNIGFGGSWGRWPLYVVGLGLALSAGLALIVTGGLDSPLLGAPLDLWLAYCYGHLGASFVLAAVIATPGCEMRAFPDLIGRMSGEPRSEHPCPVAFLAKLDAWERNRATG